MNFGPLNKSGGERRLNVAITRATTEVVIFSSFGSESIDLSRTSAQAVQDLKHYMEFAERGPQALAEQTTADYGVDHFDSDFEEAVAWDLRQRGWKVQTHEFELSIRVVSDPMLRPPRNHYRNGPLHSLLLSAQPVLEVHARRTPCNV